MDHINKAVEVLNNGGVVIFPTDTAFGIGCRIDDHKAIERLFALRKRSLTQPPPVLVSSLRMAQRYGDFTEEIIEKLVDPYWPGALTIIVPTKDRIDPLVQKDGGVGLRVPDHQVALEIVERIDCALLGSSANFPGNPTPYKFEDLDPDLVGLVNYVVPGQTNGSEASTVINTIVSPWQILRDGAIKVAI